MSYDIDNIVNICELAIKNCMTPAVYSALRRINKRLERIYGERYKLVLSGGSVFGIYFDESEVDVFKTHDFDVKFVDEDDNIFSMEVNEGDVIFFEPSVWHRPHPIPNSKQERISICGNITFDTPNLYKTKLL